MLMQARDKTTGEPLSDDVIGGLVSEFIRVGTDTTATTIAFAGEILIQARNVPHNGRGFWNFCYVLHLVVSYF